MTVCSTTSSYVFSTRMNLAKSSKISSWKRGSSCRGTGREGSQALPLAGKTQEGLGRAGTHRLACGGQLLEQEGDGDLQQCLPEEPLAHRTAVIVVFLQGRTQEGPWVRGSPSWWEGASPMGSDSPSAPAPESAGWTCTTPPWWAPSPALGAGGSRRCTRHCPFATRHTDGLTRPAPSCTLGQSPPPQACHRGVGRSVACMLVGCPDTGEWLRAQKGLQGDKDNWGWGGA